MVDGLGGSVRAALRSYCDFLALPGRLGASMLGADADLMIPLFFCEGAL